MAKLSYREVEDYLRSYSTEPPYDFNGLLQLMLTAVDNLREHCIDADLEDYGGTVTGEQAEFLRRLLSRSENEETA